MVLFLTTLSDTYPRFQGHGVTIDALGVLCAQLMRGVFIIIKFHVSFSVRLTPS